MNDHINKPFTNPFEPKKLEEDRTDDVFTVRINKEERDVLNTAKTVLQQDKDSTALKQLAMIGYYFVLQDKKTLLILDYIINNKRRNQRNGIIETEINFDKYIANVTQKD